MSPGKHVLVNSIILRVVKNRVKSIPLVVGAVSDISVHNLTNCINASRSVVFSPEIDLNVALSINSEAIETKLFDGSVHPFVEIILNELV